MKMVLLLFSLLIVGIIATVTGAGTLVQFNEDKLTDDTSVESSVDLSYLFSSTGGGITTLASSIGLMLILLVFCLGLLVFCSVHRP
ncbi:MAG: hypothetical protein ACLFO6_08955 [Archaeoglobaceae archaeon]